MLRIINDSNHHSHHNLYGWNLKAISTKTTFYAIRKMYNVRCFILACPTLLVQMSDLDVKRRTLSPDLTGFPLKLFVVIVGLDGFRAGANWFLFPLFFLVLVVPLLYHYQFTIHFIIVFFLLLFLSYLDIAASVCFCLSCCLTTLYCLYFAAASAFPVLLDIFFIIIIISHPSSSFSSTLACSSFFFHFFFVITFLFFLLTFGVSLLHHYHPTCFMYI